MQPAVAPLLKGFGPSGGAGSPPAAPSLSVVDNQDGTQTATISSSTTGSTNVVFTQAAGSSTWTNSGSRAGDGTVSLSLANGRYFIYVRSFLNSQYNVSEVDVLWVNDGTGGLALDHAPSTILQHLLVTMGLGTYPPDAGAWPISATKEPDTPDNCITIYDTVGQIHGRDQIAGDRLEHYGIQFRIRSNNPAVGFPKAKSISTQIDRNVRLESVTIDGTQYIVWAITRTSAVIPLPPATGGTQVPDTKRRLWTINAIVSIRQL